MQEKFNSMLSFCIPAELGITGEGNYSPVPLFGITAAGRWGTVRLFPDDKENKQKRARFS
jgi:hypothetical protein